MKQLLHLLYIPILASSINTSLAQADSSKQAIQLSIYAEVYYAYDVNNPENNNRPDFIYSFHRHNEVNLNLGVIKASYNNQKVRSSLAVMAGTYVIANMANEPNGLKNIYESNIGLKLSKKHNLWLDAGVFESHIGFESPIGANCWNLTRSILADNSPYYETGAKVSYADSSGKWRVSGLLLNGWQRIQRFPGNNTPAFGHQVVYTPKPGMLFNSSSYIGSNFPDALRKMRYYHDFYMQFSFTQKLDFVFGFDIGFEQTAKRSKNYYTWYAPLAIFRYSASQQLKLSARCEYFSDPKQVVIQSISNNGFRTWGYSLNVDYAITPHVLWRTEARQFVAKDALFMLNGRASKFNHLAATSITFLF